MHAFTWKKIWDGVLTFDTYLRWWKSLKNAWESYLLLDHGLPERDFGKQVDSFSKNH